MSTAPKPDKRGRLNKNLRPRPCSGCPGLLSLRDKVLCLDLREYSEGGMLPVVNENEQHAIYLFCSVECLHGFMARADDAAGTYLGLE